MSEFNYTLDSPERNLYFQLLENKFFRQRFTRFIDGLNNARIGGSSERLRYNSFEAGLKNLREDFQNPRSLFPKLLDLAHDSTVNPQEKAEQALALSKEANIPIIMVQGNFAFTDDGANLVHYGKHRGMSKNCGTVVPWIKAGNYIEVDQSTFQKQQETILRPDANNLSWVMIMSHAAKQDILEVTHEAMAFHIINKLTPADIPRDRKSMLSVKKENASFQLRSTLVLWDFLIQDEEFSESFKAISLD